MAFPRDLDELRLVLEGCAEHGVPWRVLGRGSNVVVADEGVRGVVVHTRELRTLRFDEDGTVVAGAGLPTSVLLAETRRRGLGGLEAMVGYPASVGGAARMNAGGRWGETGARVERVVAVGQGGVVHTLSSAECGFGYRTSTLGRFAVAEVVFRLPRVDPEEYRRSIDEIHREKSAAQPLADPSAGCVFRNPGSGISAGRLLDECGLKGRARGGAMVSPVHANFVVNRGGATAREVLDLIDEVRDEVERRSGIALRREVEVWGAEDVPGRN